MIAFIIPIIHPAYPRLNSYKNILIYLSGTLNSLINCQEERLIIVVGHYFPDWLIKQFIKVHFIKLKSDIFKFLKDLDGRRNTTNQIIVPNKYRCYINLSGTYHNKDKGLKYFIGLLYLNYLKINNKFVYLMDGDDFVINNIGEIVNSSPKNINMFVVQYGYLMFSNCKNINTNTLEIDRIYKLDDFSNVCGSNRIFRSHILQNKIKKYLDYNIPINVLNTFIKKRLVDEKFITILINNIKKFPNKWNILPKFLGTHRIFHKSSNSYPHNFIRRFTIREIPIRSAIKYIHTSNHSCNNIDTSHNTILAKIVNEYKNIGIIEKGDEGNNLMESEIYHNEIDTNVIYKDRKYLDDFGINNYIFNHFIQN